MRCCYSNWHSLQAKIFVEGLIYHPSDFANRYVLKVSMKRTFLLHYVKEILKLQYNLIL